MELTKYECDGCGAVHGHRTDMVPIPIRHESDSWIPNTDETLHLCIDNDGHNDVVYAQNRGVNRWCVDSDGNVVGFLGDVKQFVPLTGEPEDRIHKAAEAVEEVV